MTLEESLLQRRKERWVVFAFFFLSGIVVASWASRIPEIQQKLHLDNSAWGTVLFSLPFGMFAGLTIGGWLVEKLGTRHITLFGCLMNCLMLCLAGSAATPILLMLVLFTYGLCRTIFNLSINTSAVELQKQYDRPIIASFHGIWSMACFIAAGIGQVMIIFNIIPVWHFLIIAITTASLALLSIGKKADIVPQERRPFFVMPDKYLFLLGIMALCAMLCEGAMFDWSVNYFEKVVKAKKQFVTAGYSSFIIMMALGRLIGDRFIAAFGVFGMLRINGLLMAVGFVIASLFPFLLPAAFGFLLVGLGDSILIPMIYLLASKTNKMSSAYALSSVILIGNTGFLIGPLFIGNVSQYWGMSYAFLILSGISLLIIFLSFQVRKLSDAIEEKQ